MFCHSNRPTHKNFSGTLSIARNVNITTLKSLDYNVVMTFRFNNNKKIKLTKSEEDCLTRFTRVKLTEI